MRVFRKKNKMGKVPSTRTVVNMGIILIHSVSENGIVKGKIAWQNVEATRYLIRQLNSTQD